MASAKEHKLSQCQMTTDVELSSLTARFPSPYFKDEYASLNLFYNLGGRGRAIHYSELGKRKKTSEILVLVDQLPPQSDQSPFIFLRDKVIYKQLQSTLSQVPIALFAGGRDLGSIYVDDDDLFQQLKKCEWIDAKAPALVGVTMWWTRSIARHEFKHLLDVLERQDIFDDLKILSQAQIPKQVFEPIKEFVFEQRAYLSELAYIQTRAMSESMLWYNGGLGNGQYVSPIIVITAKAYRDVREVHIDSAIADYAKMAAVSLHWLKKNNPDQYLIALNIIRKHSSYELQRYNPEQLFRSHYVNSGSSKL